MTAPAALPAHPAARPTSLLGSLGLAGEAGIVPIVAVFYSFLLIPPEARLFVAGLALPPYRLVIIPLTVLAALAYLSKKVRPAFPDTLVLLSAFWTMISFFHHYGTGSGFIRAAGVIFDSAGAYFIARSSIRTPRDLRIVLILIAPPLFMAGFIMLLESVSHRVLLRALAMRVFGTLPLYEAGVASGEISLTTETRLGLMRAFGPFSHPILGGVVLTSLLTVYATSGLRSWPRVIGMLAAAAGFFALSSASILALVLGGAAILIDRVVKQGKGLSWWLVLALIGLGMVLIEVGTKRGIVNVLISLTLNPQTGYFRKAIWEYGLASIDKHPLYGIGYAAYERPSWMHSGSVDAHFLALGIRDGMPTPLLLLLATIVILVSLGRAVSRAPAADRAILFGMNTALAVLLIASMTVTYFSEAQVWFMAMLGIGASLSQVRRSAASPPLPARP